LKHRGRLSSTFVPPSRPITSSQVVTRNGERQHSIKFHTVDGEKFDYDSLSIFTLVEESGGLKVAEFKDFSDPEKRGKLYSPVAKSLSKTVT
jgi:hypothetical protein